MLVSFAKVEREAAIRQIVYNMNYEKEQAESFLSYLLEVQLLMDESYSSDVLESVCRPDEPIIESSAAARASRIAGDLEIANFQRSLLLTEAELDPDVFARYQDWLDRQHVVYVAFDHENIAESSSDQRVSRYQEWCLEAELKHADQLGSRE